MKYAEDFSVRELMACFLARDFEDGQEIGAGAASPVARASALLAHFHHGPNMICRLGATRTNLWDVGHITEQYDLSADVRWRRWAESYYKDDENMEWLKRRPKDIFFTTPLQVDKYGNSNLIGIGDNYKRLKLRGPGAAGVPEIVNEVRVFYILLNRHDARTLVEKCDFTSCVGYGDGSPDYRERMSLQGGGPRYCVTPLCVMDFGEEVKRMRLKSVHPGITVDEVVKNTGFELIIPEIVPTTESPTEEELEILRTKIDPTGLLRR